MPTWSTLPVGLEPVICLEDWAVVETESEFGQRHLLGMRTDTRDARISSNVKSFDLDTMSAVTSTGRQYRLVGPPGVTVDSAYLLRTWCDRWGVREVADVTAEYVRSVQQ